MGNVNIAVLNPSDQLIDTRKLVRKTSTTIAWEKNMELFIAVKSYTLLIFEGTFFS